MFAGFYLGLCWQRQLNPFRFRLMKVTTFFPLKEQNAEYFISSCLYQNFNSFRMQRVSKVVLVLFFLENYSSNKICPLIFFRTELVHLSFIVYLENNFVVCLVTSISIINFVGKWRKSFPWTTNLLKFLLLEIFLFDTMECIFLQYLLVL